MDAMDWKTLESTYIFRDEWLTARRDKCERPDGKIIEPYYVLEYRDWVNVVAFTKTGKVLMIRQFRQAYGATIIELPGGTMDPEDASPTVAAERELLEETGYQFEQIEYLGNVSANASTSNNRTHMFLATGGEKVAEQDLDDNEEIQVMELSVDEVKQLLRENKVVQALHVTNILYAFEKTGDIKM